MMVALLAVTLALALGLVLGGYLWGARLSLAARHTLESSNASLHAEAQALASRCRILEAELQHRTQAYDIANQARLSSQHEYQRLYQAYEQVRRDHQGLAQEARPATLVRQLANELRHVLATQQARLHASLEADPRLLRIEQDFHEALRTHQLGTGPAFSAELRDVMHDALTPMLGVSLLPIVSPETLNQGLSALPLILQALTEQVGLSTAVLSDDCGLPLASTPNASDVDELAAMAAYVQGLAERTARLGDTRPHAVVLFDATRGTTLHRMFEVEGIRFTLSVVARHTLIAPHVIDGALGPLHKVLARATPFPPEITLTDGQFEHLDA